MKKNLLKLAQLTLSAVLAIAAPLVHATLATTNIEGDNVLVMRESASAYYGDASRYDSFWTCEAVQANGPGQTNSDVVPLTSYSGSVVLGEPGSVYGAEMTLGFVGMVSTNIQSYPAANPPEGFVAIQFDFVATPSSLALDPYWHSGLVVDSLAAAQSFVPKLLQNVRQEFKDSRYLNMALLAEQKKELMRLAA